MTDARDLARTLAAMRFRLGNEAILQADVEAALQTLGVEFDREHRLALAERVDFFVDGHIALELKIRANRKRIYRQLERYAKHDAVDSLILMTGAAMGMPPTLNSKPVFVILLGRTCL